MKRWPRLWTAEPRGREPSARNDAVEFLRQVLAEGPMTVKEVQRWQSRRGCLVNDPHRRQQAVPRGQAGP